MKSSWWNPRISVFSFCVCSLFVHFVLKQVLARHDVVSCIFSAGSHLPLWMIAATVAFVMARVTVFFVIPAVIAWKAVLVISERLPYFKKSVDNIE